MGAALALGTVMLSACASTHTSDAPPSSLPPEVALCAAAADSGANAAALNSRLFRRAAPSG